MPLSRAKINKSCIIKKLNWIDCIFSPADPTCTLPLVFVLSLKKTVAASSKKIILNSEPFDDIMIIGISAPHTDFVMAWHLNNTLKLKLVKKENLRFSDQKTTEELSFYYYNHDENSSVYNLVMLSKKISSLTNLPQSTDFMLIIRNNLHDLNTEQLRRDLRSIKGVVLSYIIDWQKYKTLDSLLEQIDLHELGIVRASQKPLRRRPLKLD